QPLKPPSSPDPKPFEPPGCRRDETGDPPVVRRVSHAQFIELLESEDAPAVIELTGDAEAAESQTPHARSGTMVSAPEQTSPEPRQTVRVAVVSAPKTPSAPDRPRADEPVAGTETDDTVTASVREVAELREALLLREQQLVELRDELLHKER